MRYTELTDLGAVHLQSIVPLDERIVRFSLSARVPNYKKFHSDSLIEMYARLALTGTQHYSKEALESYFRSHGITISVSGSAGHLTFNVTVVKRNLRFALQMIRELIFFPKHSQAEFSKMQARVLEEIREEKDNAKALAETDFINGIFPRGSVWRRETLSESAQIIRNLTLGEIRSFGKLLLSSEWFCSTAAGKSDLEHFRDLAKALSRTAQPSVRVTESYTHGRGGHSYRTVPGKTNVELRIGNILPITLRDDDYPALSFGLAVLGKPGGFSGRLMSTVREKEGLTYGIYAQSVHHSDRGTGLWNIYTFFTARDMHRGISSTLKQLRKIVSSGVTEGELDIFKKIFLNQHLFAHESNKQRLSFYHRALLKGIGEDDIRAYMQELDSLSINEINAALLKYINPKKLFIAGAGPVRKDGTPIV